MVVKQLLILFLNFFLTDLFFIHPDTGVLTLKPTAELDYEFVSDFNLTIIATDAGTPSFSGNVSHPGRTLWILFFRLYFVYIFYPGINTRSLKLRYAL